MPNMFLETRKRFSITRKGKGNPFYGKKHNQEWRDKILLSRIGSHHTEETKKIMSIKATGKKRPKVGELNKILKRGWKGGLVTLHCSICGKKYQIKKHRINISKTCSNKCRGEYYSKVYVGKNNPCWKDNKSSKHYGIEFNNRLRKEIRKRDGFKCGGCGVPEIECERKLSVHHIDYNKKNCNINNLISLCVSCHIKTNTNRKYWKMYFTGRLS